MASLSAVKRLRRGKTFATMGSCVHSSGTSSYFPCPRSLLCTVSQTSYLKKKNPVHIFFEKRREDVDASIFTGLLFISHVQKDCFLKRRSSFTCSVVCWKEKNTLGAVIIKQEATDTVHAPYPAAKLLFFFVILLFGETLENF